MSTPVIGEAVADFELDATGDQRIRLSDLKGKKVVLYFYPKDNTPGCTQEGKDFRDNIAAFEAANTVVFGVSRDTLRKHENFKAKYDFPFELLADTESNVCDQFDIIRMKSTFGKTALGLVRSTFLIDENGILRQEWRALRVKGHVEEVLAAAQAL